VFLAVEGPNGVGKSTVVASLVTVLGTALGAETAVVATREPSDSPLGRAARAMESELSGVALAMACAADRLHHVQTEIAPALARGAWVVTDRYVPSSLVLQRLDGMDTASIWALNETALRPDLTVYLLDAPETIAARLATRTRHPRLETTATPELELELYADAQQFLAGHGWNQLAIHANGRSPQDIAAEIAAAALQ
jgi:dTMP kinase